MTTPFLLLAAALPARPLSIGDAAPPLRVAAYAQGKAVDLRRGVHVVEFWATWCGPCRMSIPHLTEMAKKYRGKADFTGVSIWENGEDQLGQVRRFVAQMGARMAYNVAWDGPARASAAAWMDASGQDGIPTAFLVREGRILWIGSPLDGLDQAIAQTVAGTYDIDRAKREAARAAADKDQAQRDRAAYQRLIEPIRTLEKAKDYAGALRKLDELTEQRPDLRDRLEPMRFVLLVETGSPEQMEFARRLATESYKDRGGVLAALAWTIVAPDGKIPNPNYAVARVLSERAVQLRPEDCTILATHARVLFLLGDRAKAVEVQTRALERAKLDPRVGEDGLAPYRKDLEAYRGA